MERRDIDEDAKGPRDEAGHYRMNIISENLHCSLMKIILGVQERHLSLFRRYGILLLLLLLCGGHRYQKAHNSMALEESECFFRGHYFPQHRKLRIGMKISSIIFRSVFPMGRVHLMECIVDLQDVQEPHTGASRL